MRHSLMGERTLMRIFCGERDRCARGPAAGQPLHEALVALLRNRDFAGATVVRGLAGFGASARMHTAHLLDLSLDLPLVVVVVDTEEKIQGILPELDEMVDGGLITLEKVRVVLYRPDDVGPGPE
jgi:PII-like signaling protein